MGTDDSDPVTLCPECNGRIRIANTESICEECGLVFDEDTIDRGPEWRSFEDGPDRRRTGASLTRSRHDHGLSTEIGYGTGSRLTGRKRHRLARMRREHNRARISTKAEYNQVYAFNEISRIIAELSLAESVCEQACVLFDSAQSEELLPGRSIEGFAAAAVYAVCRQQAVARTIAEIVAVSRATEAELKVAYDALNRELGLPVGPIEPTQYLPRYASKLNLEPTIERHAQECVSRLREACAIGGRNPSGVAAACLYVAARDCPQDAAVTQTEAAEVADVRPVTIRATAVELDKLDATEEEVGDSRDGQPS